MNDPWCKALHDSTACLRDKKAEDADLCLAYLLVLQQQLEKEGICVGGIVADEGDDDCYEDDKVPGKYPIRWSQFCASFQDTQDLESAMATGLAARPKAIRKNYHPRLAGQRLLTRIFTSRSEIYATKATHASRIGDWSSASRSYEQAILQIHRALETTDTAIAKLWNRREQGLEVIYMEQELLVDDASIVVVALESLAAKRDKILAEAKREESRLLRKLKPQWESRDAIKTRLGADRWENNPNPKRDFARARAELEDDLKHIREAVTSLEENDPNQFLQKASILKEDLLTNNHRNHSKEQSNNTNRQNSLEQREKHRYNNQRPTLEWIALRVSLEDYPDPVDFGWTFTGSWEAAEFFEKQVTPTENPTNTKNSNNSNSQRISQSNNTKTKLVKLDWYFTTATIKTSLDHPIQGKTQLFAKQCTPDLYSKVLANPRTHTGKRYQRKPRNAQSKQKHHHPR